LRGVKNKKYGECIKIRNLKQSPYSERRETFEALTVEFKATSLSQGKILRLHEKSRFVKEHDQWLYVDGDIKGDRPPNARVKKVDRNELCPCGSSKKFKKYCGP
jgi:uncharacterized protein YchJ